MKRILLLVILIAALPLLAQMTTPRVYVQKLLLEDGARPLVTSTNVLSAKEYLLRAWMEADPEEVISTETDPVNTITVKQIGKEGAFPVTVVATVQLGNFKRQWKAGDILHLVITHKESGESKGWQLEIPEGTHLIKHLDDALVIPPAPKKK